MSDIRTLVGKDIFSNLALAANPRELVIQTIDRIRTPDEKRQKIRNSCLSGHSTDGQRNNCPLCQQARFYQLTTGYYQDAPTVENVRKFILEQDSKTAVPQDDFVFVLKYMGLPEAPTVQQVNDFLDEVQALENITDGIPADMGSDVTIQHPFTKQTLRLPSLRPIGKSMFWGHMVARSPIATRLYGKATQLIFDPEITDYTYDFASKQSEDEE